MHITSLPAESMRHHGRTGCFFSTWRRSSPLPVHRWLTRTYDGSCSSCRCSSRRLTSLARRLATGSWLRSGRFVKVSDFRNGMIISPSLTCMTIFLQLEIVQENVPHQTDVRKSMAYRSICDGSAGPVDETRPRVPQPPTPLSTSPTRLYPK